MDQSIDIQSAYQDELQKLEQINDRIQKQLDLLQKTPRYKGHDYTEQVLESIREENRRKLGVAQFEPYFGRLDFQESKAAEPAPLYIGKAGVEDEHTGKPLIIDWRAPVASLFYSFTGGEDPAEYESPDGIIEGLVYLKRSLLIRKQILQRVTDTYQRGSGQSGVSDEFLLYRLGENKDNKLRDIVSTIQAEQDKIIRAAKNKALIIQGVAGSGKTTVALHRLAYLLYQYRDQVRADQMIIFAPNRMFLDYISGVLPELGVGDIQQTTFSDWTLERIGGKLKLADESRYLEERFSVKGGSGTGADDVGEVPSGRWKGSAEFTSLLDEELKQLEARFIPADDYRPWDDMKLPGATIREWFYVENVHDPVAKRAERVHARIKRWIEMRLEAVRDPKIRKDRKSLSSTRLKAYLKLWPDVSALSVYRGFYESEAAVREVPASILEPTVKRLKKNEVLAEDLAPLLYIHNHLNGISGNDRFDHIVIDEAQDFSPLQVLVLKQHSRNSSFTILGDLAQGIHDYKGAHSWDEFASLFGEDETSTYQLNRSYRSTMEIIHFANRMMAYSDAGVEPAVPVFRSGEPVRIQQMKKAERVGAIVEAVREMLSGENQTVAVIGRTEADCRKLHAELAEAGLEGVQLLTANHQAYSGGISVLPVYMSKGFEFDAVLLVDVEDKHYRLTPRDAKLLYVGCTRALHQLRLHYTGTASPLLQDVPLDEDGNVVVEL